MGRMRVVWGRIWRVLSSHFVEATWMQVHQHLYSNFHIIPALVLGHGHNTMARTTCFDCVAQTDQGVGRVPWIYVARLGEEHTRRHEVLVEEGGGR